MGKKLESNFTNMVVVLFSVTLIASAAVGYVYSLTAGPIEAAKQAKQVNAIREVIPPLHHAALEGPPHRDQGPLFRLSPGRADHLPVPAALSAQFFVDRGLSGGSGPIFPAGRLAGQPASCAPPPPGHCTEHGPPL